MALEFFQTHRTSRRAIWQASKESLAGRYLQGHKHVQHLLTNNPVSVVGHHETSLTYEFPVTWLFHKDRLAGIQGKPHMQTSARTLRHAARDVDLQMFTFSVETTAESQTAVAPLTYTDAEEEFLLPPVASTRNGLAVTTTADSVGHCCCLSGVMPRRVPPPTGVGLYTTDDDTAMLLSEVLVKLVLLRPRLLTVLPRPMLLEAETRPMLRLPWSAEPPLPLLLPVSVADWLTE